MQSKPPANSRRGRLDREQIVRAAASVADEHGFAAVSMRSVGKKLGVEAMSLYHHVRNKDELLDELVAWVIAQIALPEADAEWRAAMRERAHNARAVLATHPWAVPVLESRSAPSAALLVHHDRVLGWLFRAGFSAAEATHAFSTVDAFLYGFVISESNLPFANEPNDCADATNSSPTNEAEFADAVAPDPEQFPNLARSLAELLADGTFQYADEFDAGLELILDSVERRLQQASNPAADSR